MLEQLEREARVDRRGLWADSAPIPPWGYRKAMRGQSLDLSDMVPFPFLIPSSAIVAAISATA